jgi:hypothetical protein
MRTKEGLEVKKNKRTVDKNNKHRGSEMIKSEKIRKRNRNLKRSE